MRRVFVLALSLTILLPLLAVLLAFAAASSQAQCGGAVGPGSAPGVPANLLAIYEQAAGSYQLGPQGWAYLAAINEIETNFGHDLSVSTAGAIGWMQFTPATWAQYQVSADPAKPGAPAGPRGPVGRDLHRRPLPEGQRRPRRLADGAVRLQPRRLVRRPSRATRPTLRTERRHRRPGDRRAAGRVRHRRPHHTRTGGADPARRARGRPAGRAGAGAGRDRGRQPDHRHLLQHRAQREHAQHRRWTPTTAQARPTSCSTTPA